MPKGVPKTQGEKLKDDFEGSYKQMKKEFRRGKNERKSSKSKAEDCACKECESSKKKK